jgi:hypothetical protein
MHSLEADPRPAFLPVLQPNVKSAGPRVAQGGEPFGSRTIRSGETRRVWHDHDALEAGERRRDASDSRREVNRLSGIAVAVDGEKHPGLDLAEPVEHSALAEIGRAARPGRAQAGRGQHGHDRLREVGHEPRHPVTSPDAHRPERRGEPAHLLAELAVGEHPLPAEFVPEHQRFLVVGETKQVFGKVEPCAGKPLRPGRGKPVAVLQHGGPAAPIGPLIGDHAAEFPHRRPECFGLLHRPAPQRGVVRTRAIAIGETGEVGRGDTICRGRPEWGVRQRGRGGDPAPQVVGGLNWACWASTQERW